MLGAHGDLYRIFSIAADALNVREGGAGHHKSAVFHPSLLQLLAALGKPVAVHGDQSQILSLHLKEGTGVNGAHVCVRHGENGLVDHAAQHRLGQLNGVQHVHYRHFRVILGADAHEIELALAAAHLDAVVCIRGDRHDPVGQTADHFSEEAGAYDDGAALGHIRLDIGIDPFLEIVTGDLDVGLGLDQQSFQSGNGALGGGSPGGNGAGGL